MIRTAAVALAFLLLFVACDPSSEDGSRPDDGGRPSPARGGSVVVGVFGEPATLDPHAALASDLTLALASPVYRSLFRPGPQGEAMPDLVQRVRTSGEIATLVLAEAAWSDGRPITARDVAASIRRARGPSGLARIDSVQVRDRRRLVVAGRVDDWPSVLSRASYVLPADNRPVYSGPFVARRHVEGLQLTLRRNPKATTTPLLDRVTVRFVDSLEIMLGLLAEGRLDVAWLPSSVNLDQRLTELGVDHARELGWETVVLDLEGSDLSADQRRVLARALDRAHIEGAFIRDAGRVSDTLAPEPGRGGAAGPFRRIFRGEATSGGTPLQVAAPNGDDLLRLIQRLVQVQLENSGFEIELVTVDARRFYGEWAAEDPIDSSLRRLAGGPGAPTSSPRGLDVLPLFQVETVIAWSAGVDGIEVDGTLHGPLSNAHLWHLTSEGD